MSDSSPIEKARILGSIYGQRFDANPLTYPYGVALSGRLRLATLEQRSVEVSAQIATLVEPVISDPKRLGDSGPSLAAGCFADELFHITGDVRHRDFLVQIADRFIQRALFDPDIRVEDFFYGGTLLGRAYKLTEHEPYADALMHYLCSTDTLQDNGLYWHCHGSPYFWGRGNAFAALGFAEALSYVPLHPQRDALIERNHVHLAALAGYQDPSGLWHQVIDNPGTYLEHSATCLIGYAIARGIRRGWLRPERWQPVLDSAWQGIAARIGAAGELEQVCVSTGPLDSLDAYVNRAYSNGRDDRGGAMALWFATEMAAIEQ